MSTPGQALQLDLAQELGGKRKPWDCVPKPDKFGIECPDLGNSKDTKRAIRRPTHRPLIRPVRTDGPNNSVG